MTAKRRSPQALLMQGALAGCLMKGDVPLKIVNIHQPTDEEGTYTETIEITLFSGRKIKITVEDLEE
jgi:hypothetical protein